jgi:hypothetical protein
VAVDSIIGHDWIALAAGVFLWVSTVRGIRSGTVRFARRTVKRVEDSSLYWFAVGLYGVLGLIALLTVIYDLVHHAFH